MLGAYLLAALLKVLNYSNWYVQLAVSRPAHNRKEFLKKLSHYLTIREDTRGYMRIREDTCDET